jgi:hypothetical protein
MNRQLGAIRRPRPEAYTAPVSPLIPTAPVRATKRPASASARCFWWATLAVLAALIGASSGATWGAFLILVSLWALFRATLETAPTQ